MQQVLADVLRASGGVIARRDHPDLSHAIDVAARRGEIVRVLPGVYIHTHMRQNWRARARAVNLWDPEAVIVGEAAAALTFWPRRSPSSIEVAARRTRVTSSGFRFETRTIPPDLIITHGGVRLSDPAVTAIDLAPRSHGDSIDDALRTRKATLERMHQSLELIHGRRGNIARQRFLLESRDEPWSSGERTAHRYLREAGITQWRANVPILCEDHKFFQDIAFDDCPLVVEIDGLQHTDPSAFDYDRWRGNLLLLAGKQVLRFTTPQLESATGFVPVVQRARAMFR